MIRLSKILIATPSSVLREVLRVVLRPHADEIATAGSRREARSQITAEAFQLVISDVSLPDGDGFQLLADARALEGARPDVILVADHASFETQRRALELGAVGYLVKPIAYRDIAQILKQRSGAAVAKRRPRRRLGGHASVMDLGSGGDAPAGDLAQCVWYARDVSPTGAFLETESPIAVGTVLDLALDLAGRTARVRAEVVRVQEPDWGRAGGVGVSFVDLDQGSREMLEAYVTTGRAADAD